MTYAEKKLLRSLLIRWPTGRGFATVYNTRKRFSNLLMYRALERAGKLEITHTRNATTENMLYGMTSITFTLKD